MIPKNELETRDGANLIESLQTIKDFRAAQGRRYQLWLILLLIIMGTMSGCRGYQALEDFGVRHYRVLSEKLRLTVNRLPSDTTFRRILHQLDFHLLTQQFGQWASSSFDIKPNEWIAIDGKSIKGTVQEAQTAYQNAREYSFALQQSNWSSACHRTV